MYSVRPEAYSVRKVVDESEQPLVVMGIGVPGSGRSTLLDQVAWLGGPHSPIINVDSIRNRFVRMRASRHLERFTDHEVQRQVQESISSTGIAIIDAPNVEKSKRIADIECYRNMGAVAIGAVFLDTPIEYIVENNTRRVVPLLSGAIYQMEGQLQYQPPATDEGYDWILKINHDNSINLTRV